MRKFTFYGLLLSVFLLPLLSAQQQEPVDTNLTILRMTDPGILLERQVFTLPLTFAIAIQEENRQLPLYQSFAGTPQSFTWEQTPETDLTAPLMLQLYQSTAEKAFRITLGAAGTAGALYIAYKHVKKYGLK